MEKDDVGGQKHRQTKTEVDEDEDRCTLGLSKVAAPFQLMTPQSNTDRADEEDTPTLGLSEVAAPLQLKMPQSDEVRT